jgi:hypothetical protein
MARLFEILTSNVESWAQLGHPSLLERFVLRNGKPYSPGPRKGLKGPAKQCYMNAAKVVMCDADASAYVEGFVVIKDLPIPILHAWVSYDGETVMDPTLDSANREYFGVSFTRRELVSELRKTKVYGLLDTGRGFNADLMFRRDPELKAICNGVKAARGVVTQRKLAELHTTS